MTTIAISPVCLVTSLLITWAFNISVLGNGTIMIVKKRCWVFQVFMNLSYCVGPLSGSHLRFELEALTSGVASIS